MPAVSGGDEDCINVIPFQNTGHIFINDAIFVSIMLIGLALYDLASLLLWIGDSNELSILLLEETIQNLLTSSPHSDTA